MPIAEQPLVAPPDAAEASDGPGLPQIIVPVISDDIIEKFAGQIGAFDRQTGQFIAAEVSLADLLERLNKQGIQDFSYNTCTIN